MADDVNGPQVIWERHGRLVQSYGLPSPRQGRPGADEEVFASFVEVMGGRIGVDDKTPPMPPIPEGDTLRGIAIRSAAAYRFGYEYVLLVGGGELFAIIGPNGAGKTSLFNVLSGVYRPQRGSVEFLGESILGVRPHRIAARGLARTFQNIALFSHLTVLDNLMLGRHQHIRYGFRRRSCGAARLAAQELEHRAVVEEIVDFLELEAWRTQPVGLLPYGVQKRVELGRALAMEPKLLLLDEPVAGMNLEETEDTARYILDIRDELTCPSSWSSTTWAW